MKKLNWNKTVKNGQYSNMITRILLAIFSAHLIITYEEEKPYLIILTSPNYYIALAINSLMAYVLIHVAYKATKWLDCHYPWTRNYRKRTFRQFIGGIIVPLILSMIMASLYFAMYNISILKTVYFSRYFQQIFLMLVILNFYFFYLWHKVHKGKSIPKRFLEGSAIETDLHSLSTQIACIFIEGKNYFALNFNGEKQIWNKSLIKSIDNLPRENFYMIKRSFIINRAAISDLKIVTSKKIKILMVSPLNLVVEVSQRENVGFKKWYTKYVYTEE